MSSSLKTALIDRSFFSNKKHPARRLLDHLAAAAIGATGDAGYCAAFELVAAGIIDEVCRDFKVDVATFDVADSRLLEFVDSEQKKVSAALDVEVVQALAVEQSAHDAGLDRQIDFQDMRAKQPLRLDADALADQSALREQAAQRRARGAVAPIHRRQRIERRQ